MEQFCTLQPRVGNVLASCKHLAGILLAMCWHRAGIVPTLCSIPVRIVQESYSRWVRSVLGSCRNRAHHGINQIERDVLHEKPIWLNIEHGNTIC